MPDRIAAAQDMIARCNRLRDENRPEAVLRGELASRLRQIFPEQTDQQWIDHYTEGTEASTRVQHHGGVLAQRFIDNLVRSTVIEYEPDLRVEARRRQGQDQVQEYAAGIIRSGTPVSQVRGILSDSIEWHIFDVSLESRVNPESCRPQDVILTEIDSLTAETADQTTAERLISFLKKHLAREQSRPLTAAFIAGDLGLENAAYRRHAPTLLRLVEDSRQHDTSVALATDLWSHFVDSLEGSGSVFRSTAYVDEVYIAILARLLCANILNKSSMLSDDSELTEILRGVYFEDQFHLHNMVEQDYFGWLLRPEYLPHILPVACEVQLDLNAYDFSIITEEDLFGRLMTQLARRSQRKLLGQEWTPQWVARALAKKCLDLLPEDEVPRFVDPCCGSGSIMSEVIKEARTRLGRPSLELLVSIVTGFDIDPLAVILAKTTWIVTLADEIRSSPMDVVVPVYHADSLFAATPITHQLPMPGAVNDIIIQLDDQNVSLPASLISPDFRMFFDDVIDWCYDEAMSAQVIGHPREITIERSRILLDALIEKHNKELSDDLYAQINRAIYELAYRMSELSVENRNGIWAFILRNTYRPGLLAGQFNGLVSNPPWLAMSQLADNPYKEQLSARALAYGIKPGGAAHLHLELATTCLLHAVDRYLKTTAVVACLVPGTIFNGQHHAKLRDCSYLEATRAVPFELQEVWGIEPGTFRVRAAVLVGIKRSVPNEVSRSTPSGAILSESGVQSGTLVARNLGSRTAWVLGESTTTATVGNDLVPMQGADLMPRPAVCIEIINASGVEWRVKTPGRRDPGYFSVKDAKKLRGKDYPGTVAPCFIHQMVQSLNLLPFCLDGNFIHVAIPARRNTNRLWEIMEAAAIRTMGFRETARRFQRIDHAMANEGVVKPLYEKVDERHKLFQQVFPQNQFLVLNGAGGSVACAALLPLSHNPDVVIDQTLYWSLVTSEDEAWYRVGLMNTDVLTVAVRAFNPEGELGPRHLHTLPNRVIPVFEPGNVEHTELKDLARSIAISANSIIVSDEYISDPTRPIAARRRRLRMKLKELPEYPALEDVATAILGIPS